MRVLVIQLPVRIVDMSVLISGMDNARPRLVVAGLVPLLMREDLSPVLPEVCPEVQETLAVMMAGASRKSFGHEERMPFPKARTRRHDQHRFGPNRLRQVTAHGRPRFHRRIIG